MDYFGILKRAWNVTWRNKVLWVLGFFAVVSSGSSGGSNSAQWQENYSTTDMEPFIRWTEQNLGLIIALAVVAVIFIMVMAVLGIAARGGLVHQVNEAEEGRPVSLAEGWKVGFRLWGRTFMISLVLALPVFAIVIVMVVLIFGASFGLAAGAGSASAAAGLGSFGALCCMLPVFIILIFAVGFVVGVIGELALRYGVLHDMSFGQAIRQGWEDLRARRGAAVMWLVMFLLQFAYSAVLLVVSLIVLVPVFLMFVSGAIALAVVLAVLFSLVLMLPGAVYNTFYSASWTVFFRSMTGVQVIAKTSDTGVGQGYMPPPPVSPAAPTPGDGPEA